MSINPSQRRNSELLHIGNLQLKLDQYQNREAYTTDDLHQTANTINKLYHLPERSCHDSVLETLARDTTNLELNSPNAMAYRLAMIKLEMQKLLASVTQEMHSSKFFRKGQENKHHVEKVVQKLKQGLNRSPEYKKSLAKKSFKKLDKSNDDFCFKTSLPHAQEIMTDKLEEAARKKRASSLKGKVSPSQEYLIDKPMIGKKLRDTSKVEEITKEQMEDLVDCLIS